MPDCWLCTRRNIWASELCSISFHPAAVRKVCSKFKFSRDYKLTSNVIFSHDIPLTPDKHFSSIITNKLIRAILILWLKSEHLGRSETQLTSLSLPVLRNTGPGALTKRKIVKLWVRARQVGLLNARNLLSHYLFLSRKGKYNIYQPCRFIVIQTKRK